MMDLFGMFTTSGDHHLAEMLSFGWEYLGLHGRDRRWWADSKQQYLDWSVGVGDGTRPVEDVIDGFSGERVAQMAVALLNNDNSFEISMDIRNNGAIRNLPDDAIVEVPGLTSAFGTYRRAHTQADRRPRALRRRRSYRRSKNGVASARSRPYCRQRIGCRVGARSDTRRAPRPRPLGVFRRIRSVCVFGADAGIASYLRPPPSDLFAWSYATISSPRNTVVIVSTACFSTRGRSGLRQIATRRCHVSSVRGGCVSASRRSTYSTNARAAAAVT